MENSEKRLSVRVSGRVHGVGFRMYAGRQARRLGLKGWVRNNADGSVSAVAEGAEARLHEFRTALRNGPDAAVVDRLDCEWEDATGEFPGFNIRY